MAKKIIKTDADTEVKASVPKPVINTETKTKQVLTPIQKGSTKEKQDPNETDKIEKESALRSKMQPYFDHNPGVDTFYVASDDCPFYSKPDAVNYQKNIDPDQNVKPIKR